MYCTYKNFNSLCHRGKLLCPTSITLEFPRRLFIISRCGIAHDYSGGGGYLRLMRGGSSRHIGLGLGEPRRDPWSPEERHDVLFWFFHLIFFSTQFLNFEKRFSLSPGPQSSLVPHCKISLQGPRDIWVSWLSGFGNKLCGSFMKRRR